MTTTGSISRWVVAARRITVVFALFAALGGGVVAVPQPAQAAPTDFVSTWTVDAMSTIDLPLYDGGSYNFTVDWGDGQSGTVTTWDDLDRTHSYAVAGTYIVTISGTIVGWSFGQDSYDENYPFDAKGKIVGISQWGTFNPGNIGGAFRGAENLDITATDAPDLTGVDNLSGMFNGARSLTNPNFSNWNTASMTSMREMFLGATLFNGGVTAWDTSSVTNIESMFRDATAFNQPLNSWDTSSVTNMSNMFRGATAFDQPLNMWDTSSVTNMNDMFQGATAFDQPLNMWDTSSVTNMASMFRDATAFNQPLNSWDTSSVTDMLRMFFGATAFDQPLNSWDTSSVTNMASMFRGATAFDQPLNAWDTSSVTNMSSMFRGATAFDQPLNMWDTSSVTNMNDMFRGATAFDRPLNSWDTSSVTNMSSMFRDATVFNQPLNSWNVSSVTLMGFMFSGAGAIDVANWSATLQGWAQQPPIPDLSDTVYGDVQALGLFYSADAQVAHDLLIEAGLSNLGSMVAAIAPTAPTITSATPGDGSAVVAFTAPTSDGGSAITGYEYRLDGGAWVPVGSTSSPFTITGLTNGTTYQVELRAVNGVGPGPVSAPVTVTPAAPATTVPPATTAPATTAPATTAPATTVPPVTTVPPAPTVPPTLPETGDSSGLVAVWAFMLLLAGVGLFGARRRALTGHVDERNSRFTSG